MIQENEKGAEMLANQQLEAYNARDIDAFLVPFSDSVEVYTFPRKLKYKGKDKMRASYEKMFENMTELHCKILNRIVYGNTVIDEEEVTGNNDMKLHALVIYTIKDGKIAEVYFVRQY